MNKKDLNQWRTFTLALVLGLALGVAFIFGAYHQGEAVEKMFGSLCLAYIGVVSVMAGRSALQHASAAGGLKTALGTLLGGPGPKGEPEPPRTS